MKTGKLQQQILRKINEISKALYRALQNSRHRRRVLRDLQNVRIKKTDIFRALYKLIDRADHVIAEASAAVMHRNDNTRSDPFGKLRRRFCIDRIIAADREQEQIDPAERRKLCVRQAMPQIAGMNYAHSFRVQHGDTVFTAKRTLGVVVETVDKSDLIRGSFSALPHALGIIVISVSVTAKDRVRLHSGERTARNRTGCVGVENSVALLCLQQKAGVTVPYKLHSVIPPILNRIFIIPYASAPVKTDKPPFSGSDAQAVPVF